MREVGTPKVPHVTWIHGSRQRLKVATELRVRAPPFRPVRNPNLLIAQGRINMVAAYVSSSPASVDACAGPICTRPRPSACSRAPKTASSRLFSAAWLSLRPSAQSGARRSTPRTTPTVGRTSQTVAGAGSWAACARGRAVRAAARAFRHQNSRAGLAFASRRGSAVDIFTPFNTRSRA
jgi:hypothetical protein